MVVYGKLNVKVHSMNDRRSTFDNKKVDTKEFEFPETVFIRDIDNRVFQGMVLQTLSSIDGIGLVEGNFIDSLLGRGGAESVKGIQADQDDAKHTLNIKVEVNICYGISIPEKAEEIQTKITEEITKLTGLHVSCVHVVFKNMIPQGSEGEGAASPQAHLAKHAEEDYSDEF
jgi:uncharacterized alkaline shock family protein YloU